MMLRHPFALDDAAVAIERAARLALAEGYRTADVEHPDPGCRHGSHGKCDRGSDRIAKQRDRRFELVKRAGQ